ncbi:MAG: diguanylate cyclase [Deferribacterota bacterium]|nr:diguanylate cyclase [Deferribacterota bacterium]
MFEYSMYIKEHENKHRILEFNERQKVEFQFAYFSSFLREIKGDISYLKTSNSHFFSPISESPIIKQFLINGNLDFLANNKLYESLDIINLKGNILLQCKNGKYNPYITPQNKLNPTIAKHISNIEKLNKGEIYISPFELYMEYGGDFNLSNIILGTAIYDSLGNKKGYLLLKIDRKIFLAEYIKNFQKKTNNIYLISSFNIRKLSPKTNIDNITKHNGITTKYVLDKFPKLIPYLMSADQQTGQFYNIYGLFTYDKLYITNQREGYFWYIFSYVPQENIEKINYKNIAERFFSRQIFFIILIFFSSIVIAYLLLTRRTASENLRISEENLRMLIESLPTIIAFLSRGEKWYISNTLCLEIFGLKDVDFENKTTMELMEYVNIDKEAFRDFFDIKEAVEKKDIITKKISFTSKDKKVTYEVKKIPLIDKNHHIRAVIVAGWDVTELQLNASTDAMTGVLNRRTGIELLKKEIEIEKRRGEVLTVAFIDINDLKYVNDNFGHNEGDFMILKVVEILKNSLRASDTICRLGGDEFLIIFVDCTEKQAREIIDRIMKKLDDFNKKGNKPYKITIAKGFAECSPEEHIDADELIALADIEMYRDKQMYKNGKI